MRSLNFLLNYNTKPRINNKSIEQIVEEITTLFEPIKESVPCSSTNHIYQNVPKETPREKIWTILFLLESPKKKEFQQTDLELDFLLDSRAESKITNIPTWKEIKTLRPKLIPLKTASRLATSQGSTSTNYGKNQLFLVSTKAMEQKQTLKQTI